MSVNPVASIPAAVATPVQPGWVALARVVRVICLISFLTGAGDMLAGTRLLVLAGAVLPPAVLLDPVLNSQVKFWGGIWFGYGLLLWWASLNLQRRADVFRWLLGILLLSGLARGLSWYQYGMGPSFLLIAMAVEVFGARILFAWHRWLLGKPYGS